MMGIPVALAVIAFILVLLSLPADAAPDKIYASSGGAEPGASLTGLQLSGGDRDTPVPLKRKLAQISLSGENSITKNPVASTNATHSASEAPSRNPARILAKSAALIAMLIAVVFAIRHFSMIVRRAEEIRHKDPDPTAVCPGCGATLGFDAGAQVAEPCPVCGEG